MKLETLISIQKKSKWIHYNLINQTMIESTLSPLDLESLPQQIKEELVFATDEKKLVEFNREYYRKIRAELIKRRKLDNKFLPKSEVVFTLWYDCNFVCPYCFQQYEYYNEKRRKKPLNINKAIELIKTKSKNGKFPPKTAVIIGGEPLLLSEKHQESLTHILSFLNETFPKINIHIISNGYHLGEFVDLVAQFENLNYIITVTFGVNRKKHREHRILRVNTELDTFEKLIKGLKYCKEKIPGCIIYIRMNFGKEYSDSKSTIKMMKEIKKELPTAIFELSSIITASNHLEYSSEYLNLVVKLLKSEEFSKSLLFKLPDSVFFLLRNTIPEMEVNEITSKPKICNGVVFTTNYDLSTDFQIQPCEDFSFYNLSNDEYLEISTTAVEILDNRTEECINCPFFLRCITNPCNIIKKSKIEKEQCYAKEAYPYKLVLKNFYH